MTVRLSALYAYPLKSGRAVPLNAAEVVRTGLRDDRRWMVVDRRGRFRSQREDPRLGRITPTLHAEQLRLSAPGLPDLDLPRPPTPAREVAVTVWNDPVTAWSCGRSADEWIGRVLGEGHRLVVFPPDGARRVDPAYAHADDRVAFADGYPFHLIGSASLDELNRQLDAPLEMVRFRPNLVASGAAPYAEDGWTRIRIGEVAFRVAKPCARCVVPTLHPDTLEAGPEPLRTLNRTRKRGGNVLFGQNLLHDGVGTLRVGDDVTVLDTP
ncbi:MAG: MOSC domain-containing protein [Trueperaceae bacterium]|nr:MOSC domain-containing protein [Trueperaceae bacterium]MDZ7799452.1 MOSC domain-containing protein [Trueperaceae bacterium]